MRDYTIIKEKTKNKHILEKNNDGDVYDEKELLNIIDFKDLDMYLKSGGHRTMIKDNPKLYRSIIRHTSLLNNGKNITLRARIIFLKDQEQQIYCNCNSRIKWDSVDFRFIKWCPSCKPATNSKDFFIQKYGLDEGTTRYNENCLSQSNISKGRNTLQYFEDKFPGNGNLRYDEYWDKNFSNRNTSRNYSKISQELFWKIYDKMDDKSEIFFEELNYEKHINLNKYDKLILTKNKVRINLDFMYLNKIIEFNGGYWHNTPEVYKNDISRYNICKSKGYDILFINENEYKNNPNETLSKCIRFLDAPTGIINSRYLIKTSDGLSPFDGIKKILKNTIIFELEKNSITVSIDHMFVINDKDVYARDLIIGDYLESITGLEKIIDIRIGDAEYVYDILHTYNHNYVANNIINHNCQFEGSDDTLISHLALQRMVPVPPLHVNKFIDGLRVYDMPEEKSKYICAVDSAKDGLDKIAIQMINVTKFPFIQVASANLDISYLKLAGPLTELCKEYNNAFLVVENNEGAGQSLVDSVTNTYEYENVYKDAPGKDGKMRRYFGFRTTSRSRKVTLSLLRTFLENDRLILKDHATIDEFYHFIDIKGKYQADDGYHDDLVMALAISFAPIKDIRNLEDQKKFIDSLFEEMDEDEEDTTFEEVFAFGSFDEIDDSIHRNEFADWNSYRESEDRYVDSNFG